MSQVDTHCEPRTCKHAIQEAKWVHAMIEELDALEANNTWEITTLPAGKTAIVCKWLYKVKYNADGSMNRYQ